MESGWQLFNAVLLPTALTQTSQCHEEMDARNGQEPEIFVFFIAEGKTPASKVYWSENNSGKRNPRRKYARYRGLAMGKTKVRLSSIWEPSQQEHMKCQTKHATHAMTCSGGNGDPEDDGSGGTDENITGWTPVVSRNSELEYSM